MLLKRGMATTIKEFLLSAEYVLAGGNPNVILCERGIRTFETSTRYTLDLNAVPVIKRLSHLPVVVDPSHGTGHWEYVAPMAKAGIACGADGLIIEVHHRPEEALSDGPQSLKPDKFAKLMRELRALAEVLGRTLEDARGSRGLPGEGRRAANTRLRTDRGSAATWLHSRGGSRRHQSAKQMFRVARSVVCPATT